MPFWIAFPFCLRAGGWGGWLAGLLCGAGGWSRFKSLLLLRVVWRSDIGWEEREGEGVSLCVCGAGKRFEYASSFLNMIICRRRPDSASGGPRPAHVGSFGNVAALANGDWEIGNDMVSKRYLTLTNWGAYEVETDGHDVADRAVLEGGAEEPRDAAGNPRELVPERTRIQS